MSVMAIMDHPHDKDVPLEYILPSLLKANVGGFLFPFANSRHHHEIKLFKDYKIDKDQYLIVGAIDTPVSYTHLTLPTNREV